jgi:DNA-binding LacI/PurR family transcriptional regulator
MLALTQNPELSKKACINHLLMSISIANLRENRNRVSVNMIIVIIHEICQQSGSDGIKHMDKSKRITMIDVAKLAGVSHQTVSRVINEDSRVAPETRERVLDVIKRLNYRPSRLARGLAAHQSRTLAVISYGLSYYGPTQMMINIEKAARNASYDIFFSNIDPTEELDILAVSQRVMEWSVDGVLLIAPVKDRHYRQMLVQFTNIPVLQIDIEANSTVPSVIIDQYLGTYRITQHLLELGHRAIAEIRGPMDWHGAIARHQGFEDALKAEKLTAVASLEGNWTAESAYQCTENLLKEKQFTAIVAANDQMALGVIACLREHQLSVPDDVSVVGFDDIPEARYFAPPLTTVQQDFSALGLKGIEYLLAMIENPEAAQGQYVIQPQIIIRQSTKAV